jgi:formylglycine-generating enzyme required for sulfatase activity
VESPGDSENAQKQRKNRIGERFDPIVHRSGRAMRKRVAVVTWLIRVRTRIPLDREPARMCYGPGVQGEAMTTAQRRPATDERHEGMRQIPGGVFAMGSERFYEEERPLRRVRVDAFRIDQAPVTNREFARFVDATNYRTVAEIPPDPKDYPGLDPSLAVAGSLVFFPTRTPVPLHDPSQWWAFVPGADWRHPYGPDSDIEALLDHPVVQIAYADTEAYAAWAGKSLPTEAEWEFAARGGLEDADYAWGDTLTPDGAVLANYWQGLFPFANQRADGGFRTTPARSYPANGHGLFDMIGNVWEWTRDWYGLPTGGKTRSPCCAIDNPRGAPRHASFDPVTPDIRIGRKVVKGGSHLCAANYCQRYRPAARHAQMIESSTSHIGFRCIVRSA